MSQPIRDVLNRRTDLSTFVVHLTRDKDGRTARDALVSIMNTGYLRAETAMGWAKDEDVRTDPSKQTQRVICFSETPLEHIYSLVADIEGRKTRLRPYGLAMTKVTARKLGINPIWYVDQTAGQSKQWVVSKALDELRDAAIADGNFHQSTIAKVTPFMEQMGSWPGRRPKEFWWEREWRHAGGLSLPPRKVIWLCPEEEMGLVREETGQQRVPMLDPRWGLEQIVAHLAGFTADEWTPFEPT
jgi:hypothetical protein